MDTRQQTAMRLMLAQDDASSNLELVEYLVQDVGLSLDEAWEAVRHRFLATPAPIPTGIDTRP